MIQVSAPGKVHLIGEHAVVYGEPAILASVGRRTVARVEKSDKVRFTDRRFGGGTFVWEVADVMETSRQVLGLWENCREKGSFKPLFERVREDGWSVFKKTIIGIALAGAGASEGVSIEIEGGVPVGAGLGSSAAMALVVAKGVSEAFGKKLSDSEINDIAFDMEKIIHGMPSGGDNSACCFGGLTWFEKGSPPTIRPLKEEVPRKLENFVFVYSRDPIKSTGELVQQVKDLDPSVRDPVVKEIGKLTREMLDVLKRNDLARMKEIMNLTQENLSRLGVSVPEIDRIHEAVKGMGGAAKGCGALGGGIVLCWHEDKELLMKTLRDLSLEPWEAELAVEGVRVDG